MLRKTTAAVYLVDATSAALAGCTGSSSTQTSHGGASRDLRIGLSFGPFNLYPAKDQAGLPTSLDPFATPSPDLDALFQQAVAVPIDQGAAVWKQFNAKATALAYDVPIYKYQVPWAMNPKFIGVHEGSWVAFAGDLSGTG